MLGENVKFAVGDGTEDTVTSCVVETDRPIASVTVSLTVKDAGVLY